MNQTSDLLTLAMRACSAEDKAAQVIRFPACTAATQRVLFLARGASVGLTDRRRVAYQFSELGPCCPARRTGYGADEARCRVSPARGG